MKKIFLSALILSFMLCCTNDANAQRRRKRKRPSKEKTETTSSREFEQPNTLLDRLNIEIKPGNLFIGNNTSISLKSNVGYKFNSWLSSGIGGKFYYYWQSNGIQSVSATDYGGFLYAKAKISDQFYFVGEYNLLSIGAISGPRLSSIYYPAAGIGYMTSSGKWSSGFEILFIFSDEARNRLQLPLEYWLNFSYNF